ncbi:DUF3426 domain-containing protein [Maricaulis sp.]|uniref:DUF3426 domain-containing protein n=1 Tax=Maricaulis sp. TaxID=1486257 RepID=UPI0032997E91
MVSPQSPAEPVVEKQPHKAFRERQEKKRHTLSVAAAGGAWGALAVACAVVLTTAWIFRVDVVTLWPRASSAYAAVGAEVNPYGFSVGELDIRRDVDHGVPLLVIEGDVRNFDRRARAMPGLRAVLRDADGESVLEWTVSVPAGQIRAGKSQEFRTVVSDPPPSAVEVEVLLMAHAATGNAAHDEAGEDGDAHAAPSNTEPSHEAPSHDTPDHAPAPAAAHEPVVAEHQETADNGHH